MVFLSSWLVTQVLPTALVGQDWGRFRGPRGDGTASGNLPLSWSEDSNIAWKVAVPGSGHSSPVVGDGQIWVTTALTRSLDDQERDRRLAEVKDPRGLDIVGGVSLRALAFDLQTGRLLHDVELFQPLVRSPFTAPIPTPRPPVLQAGRLYVHFGTYGAAAIDTQSGQVIWRFEDFHIDHQNGPGSSPIVWEDLLITHYDGTDQQFLAALHTRDGSLAWRTERSGEMHPTPEMQKAYCTPTVVSTDDGPELISPAANWVYGYHPRTGSELWKASYGGLGFSTVPCPIVGHELAYVCTSFMQSRLLAVRYGGRGDVTGSHIALTSDSNVPQKPSLALVGDAIYLCSDSGILSCLEATTGKELWRHRIGGKYSASPIISGERIYWFSMEGKTTVIRAGQTYEQLAVNELDGAINASPACVGDALLRRTDTHLYRIEQP